MTDEYNLDKVKSLLKHASSTSKKIEQSSVEKKELEKQVKKIQTIATRKGVKKETINKTLEELQNKINQILSSEGKFLVVQERDERLIQEINAHIQDMGDKFNENQQKIQGITSSVNELRTKLNQALEIKKQRDERLKELEEKIKAGVDKNFQEILKIEQHIDDLEEKYYSLSNLEKSDSVALRKIRNKIDELKQILEAKKEHYAKKSKIPLPIIKTKPLPKRHFHKKPEVRHKMHIVPIPEIPREKPMPSKKPLFKKMFKKKIEPESIWKEKISIKKQEGIKLKPEKEIEFRPKPELKESLPELPKFKPEGFKPLSELEPKKPSAPPPPPTPSIEKQELPPIPEPPKPQKIEESTLQGIPPKKPSLWSKIKNIFKKKKPSPQL